MFAEGAGVPSPARRLALPRRSRSGPGSRPALLEPPKGPGCCCATPARTSGPRKRKKRLLRGLWRQARPLLAPPQMEAGDSGEGGGREEGRRTEARSRGMREGRGHRVGQEHFIQRVNGLGQ